MRYFLIGLLALLSLEASSTNSVNPAHIRGVVKDFKGGDVIMMINRKKEVVQVDDNGVFDYTTTLKEPGKAILFFEKYEYILPLYIENGMEASLTFSFVEKKDKSSLLPYDLELEYSGDNGDCTEFMQKYEALSLYNVWPFSRIDTMSFAQYREKFLEDMDRVKSELKEVKSLAFRRMMMAEIDRSIPESLFRFAWSKLKNDADFEQFAESFDRNDPDNLGIAAKYLRHYLRHHPAPEREKDIHYLNSLKQVFSDQEVINAFADEYIQSYLRRYIEKLPILANTQIRQPVNSLVYMLFNIVIFDRLNGCINLKRQRNSRVVKFLGTYIYRPRTFTDLDPILTKTWISQNIHITGFVCLYHISIPLIPTESAYDITQSV